MQENTDKIKKLVDSHDREFKWIQTQMLKTINISNKTDKLLTRTLLHKFEYSKKKKLYGEWKKYIEKKIEKKEKTKKMI